MGDSLRGVDCAAPDLRGRSRRGRGRRALIGLRAQGDEPQAGKAEHEHENDLEGTRDLIHRYPLRQERPKGLAPGLFSSTCCPH